MPDVTSESLTVLSPRRGRPRARERSVPAYTWLPESDFDFLDDFARKHDTNPSAVLRKLVKAFKARTEFP